MNFSQFGARVKNNVVKIESYFNNEGLIMVKRQTYRFLDDNFRLQGWQGSNFEPWKPNKKGTTILVHTGHLRGGFNDSASPGMVTFYNNMPYAAVHNLGFKGRVMVSAHNRAKYDKVKVHNVHTRKLNSVYAKTNETAVSAHSREMNIDQRQFAPYEGHESPVLVEAIRKELENDLKNLFKTF